MIRKPPFPVSDDDYLDAENNRYLHTAFMILPLRSGKVAVLGHMRALHAIVDTLEEAVEASKSIEFLQWRRAVAEKEPKPALIRGLNLEELDL